MKTIIDKQEFEELIHTQELVICFVHSPWAGTSLMGLQKFRELVSSRSNFCFVIIDNDSADSFIYDWLKNQEKTLEMNNSSLKKRAGSWIHGNGEMFGVKNKHLIWFETSIYNLTRSEIEGKSYFKKQGDA